jgi:hypothetical protein
MHTQAPLTTPVCLLWFTVPALPEDADRFGHEQRGGTLLNVMSRGIIRGVRTGRYGPANPRDIGPDSKTAFA